VTTVGKTLFMPRNKPEKCFNPFVSHLCAKRYLFRNRIFNHPDDGCCTLLQNVIWKVTRCKKTQGLPLFPKLGIPNSL